MNSSEEEMKPCPFCGKVPDLDDPDTLHPSPVLWRDSEEYGREYLSWDYRGVEGVNFCWEFNCPQPSGGCGVEVIGDSKEEVIAKWNKRV